MTPGCLNILQFPSSSSLLATTLYDGRITLLNTLRYHHQAKSTPLLQYLKIPSSSEINSSSPLTWLTRHLWPTAVFWLNPTTLFAHFNPVHNIKCNFTPNFNPKLLRVNSTAFFDHLELHQTKIAPLFSSAWGINPGYNIKCCQEKTPHLN